MKLDLLRYARQLGFASLLIGCGPAAGAELFVALDGDDRFSGTREKPLATLQAARDRIRELKKSEDSTDGYQVTIRGGAYYLAQPLELSAEDSGLADSPIVYRAAAGETVRLIGGRPVTGFEPVVDETTLERLADAARDQVLVADLPLQGIVDFGRLARRGAYLPTEAAGLELFFDGRPMPLAAWPNQQFARAATATGPGRFTFADLPLDQQPRHWASTADVWVHGFYENDWSDAREPLASVDWSTRELTLDAAPTAVRAGARFRVLNVLEELDQPGEWYLDREAGRIYFWPPQEPGANGQILDGQVVVSTLETPVSLYETQYVSLQGLTIEAARVMGVEIVGGANVALERCTVRNVGNVGVHVYDGESHRVVDCEIAHVGDTGLRVDGGDRQTLISGRHEIVNNHVHHFGCATLAYRPGVHLLGVGTRVANNLIHDGPHAAILLNGNEHLIEYNEIHSVCRLTDDVGAIYLGQDVSERGHVIRHNYLHDLGGFSRTGVIAVYLDDFASGATVVGNLFQRAGRGVAVGGGRDNTIANNIFFQCVAGVQIDCRGRTWARDCVESPDGLVRKACAAVGHDQGVWAERYPSLASLLDDEPAVAKGNAVERNIVVGRFAIDLHDGLTTRDVRTADNLTGVDPQFVDAADGDFRLKDSSPALGLGFQPLPLDKIGRLAPTAGPRGIDTVAAD